MRWWLVLVIVTVERWTAIDTQVDSETMIRIQTVICDASVNDVVMMSDVVVTFFDTVVGESVVEVCRMATVQRDLYRTQTIYKKKQIFNGKVYVYDMNEISVKLKIVYKIVCTPLPVLKHYTIQVLIIEFFFNLFLV